METKQTAIQIAMESYQNDGVSFTDWFMDNSSMLLAMEKEQIRDAYDEGDGNGTASEWGYERISSEEYYNETYGK